MGFSVFVFLFITAFLLLRRSPGEREREILDGLVLGLDLPLIFGKILDELDRLDVAFVREVEVGLPLALVVGDELAVGVDVTGQNLTGFIIPELVVGRFEESCWVYLRLEWFLVGFEGVFSRFCVGVKVGFCWCWRCRMDRIFFIFIFIGWSDNRRCWRMSWCGLILLAFVFNNIFSWSWSGLVLE